MTMKRASTSQKLVSAKRPKVQQNDILGDLFADDLLAELNFAIPSTSYGNAEHSKKFDKFEDGLNSLQAKLNKIEKENDMMSELADQFLTESEDQSDLDGSKIPLNEYCNFCNMQFLNNKSFCGHLLERHTARSNQYVSCSLCSDRSPGIDTFDSHLKTHAESSRCHLCPENATLTHLVQKHGYSELCYLKLCCDFCHFRTENATSLQVHCLLCSNNPKNNNYQPSEEGRVCNVCNQVFDTNLQMLRHKERHAKTVDGEELQTFVCEDCGQSFMSLRSLGGHRRKHAKKREILVVPKTVNVGVLAQSLRKTTATASSEKTTRIEPTSNAGTSSESGFEDMPDL